MFTVVNSITCCEKKTRLGHREIRLVHVGDELALVVVHAELPTLHQRWDVDDHVDQVC